MGILGTLLKNKHAGDANLAWNLPALAGPETLALRSPDFAHEATIPQIHAAKRAGGTDTSPALEWAAAPAGTAQFLLVMEDVDSPTKVPNVHCVALIDPELTALPAGALDAKAPAAGVQVLRAAMGKGYLGPAPVKGHGPHRYVFQLFALPSALTSAAGGAALDSAKPAEVLAAVPGPALARARYDGMYER